MTNLSSVLFKYRSYTPIPFLIVMVFLENANLWSLILGFVVVIIGELIRLWGVSWAGSETRTTGHMEGTYLIISGPFAYVRNPLYIGNILIYTGVGIMSYALFPYLQIIALLFFIFQYYYIIKGEEEFLQNKYGEQFTEYKKNVPRFFPRLLPYKAKNIKQPQFKLKAGLKSERRTFQAIVFIMITIFLLWFIGRL
ncbi:MAG: isoprenylcysteine carboxylmethyltransferase family protein [Ignavibacteriales bacterium]|nr:MAG: isoprenylcysteine carboxylmethyltransferase family protein [Ignavibacteriales bacterium]